jgi:hypothetical protein
MVARMVDSFTELTIERAIEQRRRTMTYGGVV